MNQGTLSSQETQNAVADMLKTTMWRDDRGLWRMPNEWPANRRAYLKENAYFDMIDRVYKWKSNDRVPPEDCLVDSLSREELARHAWVRDMQIQRDVEEYRESRKNHKPSAEELFEMRAAFGPGAEVVDVITGQTYKV